MYAFPLVIVWFHIFINCFEIKERLHIIISIIIIIIIIIAIIVFIIIHELFALVRMRWVNIPSSFSCLKCNFWMPLFICFEEFKVRTLWKLIIIIHEYISLDTRAPLSNLHIHVYITLESRH